MNQGAGKGDSPRQVDPKTYGQNYDAIFRKAKERHPVDAAIRKTFTGTSGDYCPGFTAKEFLHDTPDDDPADFDP